MGKTTTIPLFSGVANVRAMKPTFFRTSADFRAWLDANHGKFVELQVGFYKKSSGKPSITYPEALDEALCFGWIDGVRHPVNRDAYMIRFTPRKSQSQWSAVNIRKAQQLVRQGRMCDAGRKVFARAGDQTRKYSYEQSNQPRFAGDQERLFRADRVAWDFFQKQAPWYRRTTTFWVVSAKKAETRQKRLAILIHDSGHLRPIKPLARPVPKRQKKVR